MKARKWLERGKNIEDPFDALSNLWKGFNNLFYPQKGGREREKIDLFIQSKINIEQAQSILDLNAAQILYLLSSPVIDMRLNRRDTSQDIVSFQNTNNALEKLRALFMIIYQIRCNSEHGEKSPDRERDAKLCGCAVPIITNVLEICT